MNQQQVKERLYSVMRSNDLLVTHLEFVRWLVNQTEGVDTVLRLHNFEEVYVPSAFILDALTGAATELSDEEFFLCLLQMPFLNLVFTSRTGKSFNLFEHPFSKWLVDSGGAYHITVSELDYSAVDMEKFTSSVIKMGNWEGNLCSAVLSKDFSRKQTH